MSQPRATPRRTLLKAAATVAFGTVLPSSRPARAAAGGDGAAGAAAPIRLALIEGLSGPFAAPGEAVFRNLLWAVERVNARGGVRLPGGARPLDLVRFDSKGSTDEALGLLQRATDQRIGFVLQGNSSAVAGALVEALNRHNAREPERRALLLNYSAVDPVLTHEQCSPWHFRFDAHADMRLAALMDVLKDDAAVQRVYLIGQDYSFGQALNRQARAAIAARRPDIAIVGEELHPMGRVKDFLPYATKIRASGAQAVVTGNWGNDLTLLVKAVHDLGIAPKFYTFYGNALGAPAALGEAGVGRVLAVAEWFPNQGDAASDALVAAFRRRYPDPRDDYLHLRMQLMVEMLVQAIERARSDRPDAVARALEGLTLDARGVRELGMPHEVTMRPADHQLQQPMTVAVMDRAGAGGVKHDVEGSGYGFRPLRRFAPAQVELPTRCRMPRVD